jgi:NADP-dependent aldehyde dehydrogenase
MGTGATFRAIDPSSGAQLEPEFPNATDLDICRACDLAEEAFDVCRETPADVRARLLETIADEVERLGQELIERAVLETGLPAVRLLAECKRTTGQLRMLGSFLRSTDCADICVVPGDADRTPLARPDLRLRHIGVGPVAVFGASNFPLAFSVAGGDTASALAAGCPVVIKGHPAHPGTSELVGRAVRAAVRACDLPEGVFSLLSGTALSLGASLVSHPAIKSVAFTGSRRGGLALMAIAASRPDPIPVHAEMSSINPVFLLPGVLETRSAALAVEYVTSLTLGSGQFCTNPGLVIGIEGPALDLFLAAAAASVSKRPSLPMLTPEIHAAYDRGVERLMRSDSVALLARGIADPRPNCGTPALFHTDARAFASNPGLAEENFGASSLIVRCAHHEHMSALAKRLEGQLTATVHCGPEDIAAAGKLLKILERKAGRILFNGWPTGVEVSPAMVHGGPFPATSSGQATSVGTLAIKRFVRPVCYQDCPNALLPSVLR